MWAYEQPSNDSFVLIQYRYLQRRYSDVPLSGVATGVATNTSRVSMTADWMLGQPRPPYLDGFVPGHFGFDPLRLGEVPSNLERFKESELIHCRWAMLAVPGILLPEALGLGNWVKAQEWAALPGGQATYLGNPTHYFGNRVRPHYFRRATKEHGKGPRKEEILDKLSAALAEINAKDEIAKKQTNIAREAIQGWEKAEIKVLTLQQELEKATQQRVADEERLHGADAALKECMLQVIADSSSSSSLSEGTRKMKVTPSETVTVGDLRLTDTNKTIEVRVYRIWTARNVPHPEPTAFGCILD
ncbi:chlorophyll A/B binding protein 6A, chloroplastic [Tanacetum coccineum]